MGSTSSHDGCMTVAISVFCWMQIVDARAAGGPELLGTAPVGENPARTSWAPVRTYSGTSPVASCFEVPTPPLAGGCFTDFDSEASAGFKPSAPCTLCRTWKYVSTQTPAVQKRKDLANS